MDEELKQENARLDKMVKQLLHRIEDNQQIQTHFQAFELKIFHCDELADLLEHLLDKAQQHFRLDAVSLLLNDTDHLMSALLEQQELSDYGERLQCLYEPAFFENTFIVRDSARLGSLNGEQLSQVFPGCNGIQSSALLPLVRHGEIIGCFNLGSGDAERFSPAKSADFLNHLALVIAVCLENGFGREHLRQQGRLDPLTGVLNRRSFSDEMERELARVQRYGHELSCCFIDIDHFKQVNDEHGHRSGDNCLKAVAGKITDLLRKTDILTRYGGEEFVVLLPEEQKINAKRTAERIRSGIENMDIQGQDGQSFRVTLSIGVASLDFAGTDMSMAGEYLVSAADEAMYQAKNGGRNQVCVADAIG